MISAMWPQPVMCLPRNLPDKMLPLSTCVCCSMSGGCCTVGLPGKVVRS